MKSNCPMIKLTHILGSDLLFVHMSSKSIICYIFTSYAPLNTTTKFFKLQNYCSSVSGDLGPVIVKFTRQENLLRPLNKE